MLLSIKQLIVEYLDIFNAIVGLGSLVSAIIAVFTLKEVIKQRLSTYKPEVLIKSFNLSISKNPLFKDKEELLLYKTSPFNDSSVNWNDLKFSVSKNYKIDNIGFGPAKNIICKWQFDIKKAIRMIQDILPSNYGMEHHKFTSYELYSLKDLRNDDFYYSAGTEIYDHRIDYISPINVMDNFQLHSLPEIIIFSHYLYLIFKMELTQVEVPSFYVFDFEYFPRPTLVIDYRDMNGKAYRQKSTFKVSAVTTQLEDTARMDEEFAYLNFELT